MQIEEGSRSKNLQCADFLSDDDGGGGGSAVSTKYKQDFRLNAALYFIFLSSCWLVKH